jgi:sec-independent protein translocase protein TatA
MGKLLDSPAGLILLLIVIVLFGAKRLPDAARSLGRSIRIFKSEMDSTATKSTDSVNSNDSGSDSDIKN